MEGGESGYLNSHNKIDELSEGSYFSVINVLRNIDTRYIPVNKVGYVIPTLLLKIRNLLFFSLSYNACTNYFLNNSSFSIKIPFNENDLFAIGS